MSLFTWWVSNTMKRASQDSSGPFNQRISDINEYTSWLGRTYFQLLLIFSLPAGRTWRPPMRWKNMVTTPISVWPPNVMRASSSCGRISSIRRAVDEGFSRGQSEASVPDSRHKWLSRLSKVLTTALCAFWKNSWHCSRWLRNTSGSSFQVCLLSISFWIRLYDSTTSSLPSSVLIVPGGLYLAKFGRRQFIRIVYCLGIEFDNLPCNFKKHTGKAYMGD